MTDDTKSILLPEAASRALAAFAERIGQNPQELAAAAIERFLDEEEPIAAAVLEGLADFENGRTVSHEDVVRELDEIIAGAQRKSA